MGVKQGDTTGKAVNKKGKGAAVITFDPGARQQFLTGFRKRKNERRQFARTKIAEQVRKEKLQARAERREAKQEALNMVQNSVSDDDGDDDEPAGAEVATYQFGDALATTVVESLLPEEEEEEEEDDEGRAERPSRNVENAKPKLKKYNLKQNLATAIPGYKPKAQAGGGAPKKKKLKRQRVLSKKQRAKTRSPANGRGVVHH